MKLLKTFVILVIIVGVFSGAMFGLNFYTAPIIEANNAGAANARLDAVMPDGAKAYEEITDSLTLPNKLVSAANDKRTADIVAVHKETKNDFGYVVEVAWTSEDSHGSEPNLVLVGISTDGKIIKVNNESYHDTEAYNIFNKDPNYTSTFIGKDSALAEVGTVSGSTHSSESFRSAVSFAFEVLVANNMITAGVKSDAQILEELIPTVTKGYGKLSDVAVSDNIAKAMQAENNTGFAYIVTEGDASFLAVVNATGACVVYNVEGADVTADKAAIADEAKAHAAANQTSYTEALTEKVNSMMTGATNVNAVEVKTFNTVASAVSFTAEGATYYAFYSRSIGWASHVMDIYFIMDANGAIVKTDAKQYVFEEHDFKEYQGFQGVPKDYRDGFVGITGETFTGNEVVLSGATMSTNAIKVATEDAFAAFNSVKGGEQ